jgi:hypothetical protein
MANTTGRFGFQLLYETQGQKSVVINENQINLDALMYLSCVDATHIIPPVPAPADQAVYIIAPSALGLWYGKDNQVAIYQAANASWLYFTPAAGWLAHDQATATLLLFNGTVWSIVATVSSTTTLGTLAALTAAEAARLVSIAETTDAQAARLVDLAELTPTSGNIITGTGTTWASETPLQAVGEVAAMMAIIYGS